MKLARLFGWIFTTVLLMACLPSCSDTGGAVDARKSGVTVESLENKLANGDWNFEQTKTKSGISFTHTGSNLSVSSSYTGSADKKGNVYSILIRHNGVDTEALKDQFSIAKLLIKIAKKPDLMTVNDIGAGRCASNLMEIESLCGLTDRNDTTATVVVRLADVFNGKTLTGNGWKISASVTSDMVTISAEYGR